MIRTREFLSCSRRHSRFFRHSRFCRHSRFFRYLLAALMICAACGNMFLSVEALASEQAVRIEENADAHDVMGRLLSLSAAVNLCAANKAELSAASAQRYLADPSAWSNARVERAGGSVWVGVPIETGAQKRSRARGFIRTNAPALRLFDSPGKSEWMSGDFVWFEALRSGAKPRDIISAVKADALFLSVSGTEFWWLSQSLLNAEAERAAVNIIGVPAPNGLYTPKFSAPDDEFRTKRPELPPDMHAGRGDGEFGVEMGDVIFNPIPVGTNSD